MFANVLRSQARLGLLQAARVVVPATRSLSSLVTLRAVAPTASRFATQRAFSNTAPAFVGRTRNEPSDNVFLGNLPWSTTKEDIVELLEDFGQVTDVRIPTHADGRPRGFAHITFSDKASAVAAVTSALEEPLHLSGRDLVVDYASVRKNDNAPPQQPNKRVYFSNFEQDEAAFRELLQDFNADLISVYFMRDGNTGEALSAGFLEFTDERIATEVINALNGTSLPSGSNLQLAYARPRRERSGFSPRNQNRSDERRGGHYSQRAYTPRGSDY
ncbi:hypothetical protein BDZ97DRAFT_1668273 [Flammula alnicola]|nr:hypothetical protein BDZ97DRAFT_1934777 [Flammula alnicola]KAF8958589.1 hypothetical protein BDZ97DRAFT_1668273 [Flammula alnicola]